MYWESIHLHKALESEAGEVGACNLCIPKVLVFASFQIQRDAVLHVILICRGRAVGSPTSIMSQMKELLG